MIQLDHFFYPKSICLAGASTKEKSIGYELLKTIKTCAYTGKVFPVNPKADSVLGFQCYASIEEIKEEIDLGIVAVPKQFAESTIDSLLKKNVKTIILITAGFKEIGEVGEKLEKDILRKIKSAGARLIGPNCMGIINTHTTISLNATFVAEKPGNGTTAYLSQSGALGAAVLNSLRESDIKLAHFISVGNKADLSENDFIHYWQNDTNIKLLTFYLESFVNGHDFILPFAKGEITKPAIVLKAGKTKSGMKAASSHTGALSSKDKIVDALLKQFGIIRVNDLNELFNTAKGFENFILPKGNRIAVVTNAGGPAILCADKIEEKNLVIAEFSSETKLKLRAVVNPEGSVENPVDLLPGGNAQSFKQVIEIVCEDENVDAVIAIFVEPVMVPAFETAEGIYSTNCGKPVLQVIMPLPELWQKYREESLKKLPLFRNPEDPVEIISNMLFYINTQKKIEANKEVYFSIINLRKKNILNEIGFVSQNEIARICSVYDLPIVKSKVVSVNDIDNIEKDFFPMVLKGNSIEVVHKSELNAVKLNIKNRDELKIAAQEIRSGFHNAGFKLDEFLIQQFIVAKHDLLIGGFRDPSFGPIIMFGSGGKYVEVIDDVSLKSCVICDADIEDMINSTKIGKILRGVRGEKPYNIEKLKSIINSCAKMMIENQNIEEFDINPLIADESGNFVAVDVRIKTK